MSQERATYVYCLAEARERPALAGVPPGVAGCGPPRCLAAGPGLWLIAADAPLPEYGSAAIEQGLADMDWVGERALEHEAVVEHFLGAGSVIPMKLLTLFTSDERALADVEGRRAAIDGILQRIGGCREWGLRAFFDPRRAALARSEPAGEPGETTGRAFLLRKQAERDAAKRELEDVQAEKERLFAGLSGHARAARARPPLRGQGPGRLVLDAAFLVPTAGAEAFQAEVRRRTAALAGAGYELVLSGPWPAYNFIEEPP
jgi:hypothetical protein